MSEITPLQPWQQRAVDEKRELDARLGKLSAFFDGEAFAALPDADKELLERQAAFMQGYSDTLAARIARFGGADV